MPETAVNDLPTGEDSGRPNAPDLSYSSGEWKNKRRAITSEAQGIAVCERVFHDADESIRTVAKIREKSDGVAPPFSSKALMEEGAKHRSNMPTGFMESIMGKVGPRLYSHVTGARYLYTAELPAYDPETGEQILNRVEKTEKLREVTTRVVQEWSKWYLWLVQFTEEVSRHGYCFVAWLDDIEWRPLLFRLDQGQVPFGTEIMDSNIPFFVAKDSYSVDQLFGKIRDREIAEEEGWNIKNVVEAINDATPSDRPDMGEEGQSIAYEDLLRECAPGWTYYKEARNIEVYHLFAVEHDGRVSQFMYDRKTGKELYARLDRYSMMSDVVSACTFQQGNGRVHGSYGVGHMIWDVANVVEKARNGAMDNLRARGRMVLSVGSPSDLAKSKLVIQNDVTWVVGATPSANTGTLPDVVQSFIEFDRYMREMTESKIGAFLPPPNIPGMDRTATESNIAAMREEETRRAVVDYFLKHFSLVMSTIVRRLLNPESTDPVAQAALRELRNTCTDREIDIWRNTPASASVIEFSRSQDMGVIQYLQTKIGDVDFDQKKIKRIQTSLSIGPDYAQDLIIPGEDQTIVAEAQQKQITELLSLERGHQVPVSPRDNHEIHMQVLMGEQNEGGQWAGGAIDALVQEGNPESVEAAMLHWSQHVEFLKAQGRLGGAENGAKSFAKQMRQAMEMLTAPPPQMGDPAMQMGDPAMNGQMQEATLGRAAGVDPRTPAIPMGQL